MLVSSWVLREASTNTNWMYFANELGRPDAKRPCEGSLWSPCLWGLSRPTLAPSKWILIAGCRRLRIWCFTSFNNLEAFGKHYSGSLKTSWSYRLVIRTAIAGLRSGNVPGTLTAAYCEKSQQRQFDSDREAPASRCTQTRQPELPQRPSASPERRNRTVGAARSSSGNAALDHSAVPVGVQ